MPILRLQVVESSGDRAYPADDTVRLTLRAEWTPPAGGGDLAVTAFDLLADPLCPRLGDRLVQWGIDRTDESYWNYGPAVLTPPPPPPPGVPPPPPERPGLTLLETAAGATFRVPADPDVVLVHITPRQDGPSPWLWVLELEYAGVTDPLAEAVEVEYDHVPYQTQEVIDRHGMLVCNSALDPYEEGAAKDRGRRQLTVTRNVPYAAWTPTLSDRYENTLNLLPYAHGSLADTEDPDDDTPVPVPVVSGPLTAKLRSLKAVRVLRTKSAVPGRRTYHWRVTAVIEFDISTFVDNNGVRQPKRWRTVLADAGLREQKGTGKPVPIALDTGHATAPVPLDGAGRASRWVRGPNDTTPQLRQPPTQAAKAVPVVAGAPTPAHMWYKTQSGQTLAVQAPGLLAGVGRLTAATTAAQAGSCAQGGSVAVAADGSFTYTPPPAGGTPSAPYTGYDWFPFVAGDVDPVLGAATSNPAVCVVFVAEQLKVRVFELYDPADWSAIAHLIGGW